MLTIPLQSGSDGNAIYIESSGFGILVDAGISGIKTKDRLRASGLDPANINAVLISHDHQDHAQAAGIAHRMFSAPLYMTRKTYHAAERRARLGKLRDLRHFMPGDLLEIGPFTIETLPTPHDGAEGVVFVISDGQSRLGVLTDLGHPFKGLGELIETLDGVFIECNYDPVMLESGPYPDFLKDRIKGPRGHISNAEAAALLHDHGRALEWACLAHLSEQNNTPNFALSAQRDAYGNRTPVFLADRYEAGPLLEL